ncbi:MAG: hypothetical protein R2706_13680 [Acidimicrobiales bacterium]
MAAALVSLISIQKTLDPAAASATDRPSWTADVREGVAWLWANDLLRRFAIVLGFFNGLTMMTGAVLILFAQDVLETFLH